MQFLKLALPLTASVFFLGCNAQLPKIPQIQSSPTPSETSTPNATALKEAVKELEILEDKVEGGVNYKAYSDIVANSQPIIQKASGKSKTVTAVQSAFAGHKLASEYWQCDRLEGYEELHQCRGKVLSGIFAKYPDIKAQVKVAVKEKDFSAISAELDREEILEAIWKNIKVDTEAARQGISLNTAQK